MENFNIQLLTKYDVIIHYFIIFRHLLCIACMSDTKFDIFSKFYYVLPSQFMTRYLCYLYAS